ncbi:MAG: DUF423 domain-containing protein [Verrucomicrobiae bacterium]|nr:DUF423 domain-containing protein [Verrucomicrobiae bacterium]
MTGKFTSIAGFLGFLGVNLGAFGAHGLENRLIETGYTEVWETATLYLFVHVVALLAISLRFSRATLDSLFAWAAWLWIAGIIVFSGSLYVLAISGISKFGIITPIGGLLFLAGWLCLVVAGIRGGKPSRDGIS